MNFVIKIITHIKILSSANLISFYMFINLPRLNPVRSFYFAPKFFCSRMMKDSENYKWLIVIGVNK